MPYTYEGATVSISYPKVFPNRCFNVVVSKGTDISSNDWGVRSYNSSGFYALFSANAPGDGSSDLNGHWIAIGY